MCGDTHKSKEVHLCFIKFLFKASYLLFEVYAFLKFLSHCKEYAVFCTLELPAEKTDLHQEDKLISKIN